MKVPSVAGFQLTIAGLLTIWDRLRDDPLEYLLTRRLNQDGLKNLFGVIRMGSGQNDVPDAMQFRASLRKAATNSLLLAPDSANCEPDGDSVLGTLSSVARRTDDSCPEVKVTLEIQEGEQADDESVMPLDVADANNLTYVGGYLICKGEEQHSCDKCRTALCKPGREIVYEREMLCALKSYTGDTDVDVGRLKKPTEAFNEAVVMTYRLTQSMAPSLISRPGIANRIMSAVMRTETVTCLQDVLCDKNSLKEMLYRFVRMQLHVLCKMKGENMKAQPRNKVNRKALKLSARV